MEGKVGAAPIAACGRVAPQPGSPRSLIARFSVHDAANSARWKALQTSARAQGAPRASWSHSTLGRPESATHSGPQQPGSPGKRGEALAPGVCWERRIPAPGRPPTSATSLAPGATYCDSGGSRQPGLTPLAPDTESRVPLIPPRAAAAAGSASSAA